MNKRLQNYGTMAGSSDVQFAGSVSPEFNSLCDSIVTNIYTINTSMKVLEGSLKAIGTGRDNQGLRDKIHVTQLSANQIVSVTPRDLHKLTMIVPKGDKQKKFQVDKLTENFKEAVAKYSSIQKELANKMKAHLLVIANIETSDAEQSPGIQQQIQLSRELSFQQEMLLERETRINQIEGDILDVNQIMRELATLVREQGEHVDTIENSIDHAAGNLEEGTAEIIKAAQYQNKRRRTLYILVLIAAIIAIVLTVLLVTQLKR